MTSIKAGHQGFEMINEDRKFPYGIKPANFLMNVRPHTLHYDSIRLTSGHSCMPFWRPAAQTAWFGLQVLSGARHHQAGAHSQMSVIHCLRLSQCYWFVVLYLSIPLSTGLPVTVVTPEANRTGLTVLELKFVVNPAPSTQHSMRHSTSSIFSDPATGNQQQINDSGVSFKRLAPIHRREGLHKQCRCRRIPLGSWQPEEEQRRGEVERSEPAVIIANVGPGRQCSAKSDDMA